MHNVKISFCGLWSRESARKCLKLVKVAKLTKVETHGKNSSKLIYCNWHFKMKTTSLFLRSWNSLYKYLFCTARDEGACLYETLIHCLRQLITGFQVVHSGNVYEFHLAIKKSVVAKVGCSISHKKSRWISPQDVGSYYCNLDPLRTNAKSCSDLAEISALLLLFT